MSLIDTCCCDLLVRPIITPTDEDSPTDEEARAAWTGEDFFGRIEAEMPSGNFSVQPSASVFDSFGWRRIGESTVSDSGVVASDDGIIAFEWSGWNKAVFTKDIAEEEET